MINKSEINKLSVTEKIDLISQLWDSIEKTNISIPKEQVAEVERRVKRIKEGKTKFFTWEEIKSQLGNAAQ